jgi:hypothetical protein
LYKQCQILSNHNTSTRDVKTRTIGARLIYYNQKIKQI